MEKSKYVKCIICFRKFPRKRTYKSTCGCVYICKRKCVKLLELDENSHQYLYDIKNKFLYCSLNCIYDILLFNELCGMIGHIFDMMKYAEIGYCFDITGKIYNHQHKQLNEIAYKNYYWIINKYVIDDLTNVIVEYLIE